jgi:hypothetical protein
VSNGITVDDIKLKGKNTALQGEVAAFNEELKAIKSTTTDPEAIASINKFFSLNPGFDKFALNCNAFGVEWRKVTQAQNQEKAQNTLDFQTLLYQNGIIDMNYSGITEAIEADDLPSIGMQNADEDLGVQFSGVPHSHMSCRYIPTWRYGSYFTGRAKDTFGIERNASIIQRNAEGATRLYIKKYLPIEFDRLRRVSFWYFRDRSSSNTTARLKIIDATGTMYTLADPIDRSVIWTKYTAVPIPGTYRRGEPFELVFEFEWGEREMSSHYLSDIQILYDLK